MNLKRDIYKPERYGGISLHNEPPDDLPMTTNARLYPDMYYVYNEFSKWIGVPVSQIMLGNGAENTIKNVLLALKPKSISWSIPTWGFIDVYCAQLGCAPIKHSFKHDNPDQLHYADDDEFKLYEEDFAEDIDVYYSTLKFNSVIRHMLNTKNTQKARAAVIDLTYMSADEIKKTAKQFMAADDDDKSKYIFVGSFSKLFGAGLRLGYAFYGPSFAEAMALQRENYVNQLAADFILKHDLDVEPPKTYYWKLKALLDAKKLPKRTMLSSSYITVPFKADFTQLQHRELEIDGRWYSKFGIPHDEEEWFELQMTLGLTK